MAEQQYEQDEHEHEEYEDYDEYVKLNASVRKNLQSSTLEQKYVSSTLELKSLRIERYANFSFIALDMSNRDKPFSVICKQDDISTAEVGNILLYTSKAFDVRLRPIIETDIMSAVGMCSIELEYDSMDLSTGSLDVDKLKYVLSLSKNGVEEEQMLVNGISTYYTCQTHDKPVYPQALRKIEYVSLESELIDMSDNIRDMLHAPDKTELLNKINEVLVHRIGYMDNPIQWSNVDDELLYWDDEHSGYLSITEAPINIQAVIYVILCSYNAAMNNQILIVDDFRGINIAAKIICIAMFMSFAKDRNAHLILIDDEDYQGYMENVMTRGVTYKTCELTDGSYCITNTLIVP